MNQNWKIRFAIIYVGQVFSILSSAAVQFAIIWWLTISTESALTLTIATIVAFLPNLLIGPFAGVWIDRHNRRTALIVADSLVALSSLFLGAAFLLAEAPPIPFVLVILFLRGLGNTFHGPAMQAAIPLLVPAEMLMRVGGWGNLVSSISNMLGPVLGAALIAFLPMTGSMLVDILCAALAILCLLFVTIPNIPRLSEPVHMLSDIKQGFRAMQTNKPFMAVFLPMLLVNILYTHLSSLFPLLVRTHFLGEAWQNCVVGSIFAGGLLVSSLIIGVWGGIKRRFLTASAAIGLLGAAALISGMLLSSQILVFAICCFLIGIAGTFLNVPIIAYTQESFAPEVLGKVFSLWFTAMSLAIPIGLLVAGPLCEVLGVRRWFFWSGAALVVTGIFFRRLTRPYDRQIMGRPPAQTDEETCS